MRLSLAFLGRVEFFDEGPELVARLLILERLVDPPPQEKRTLSELLGGCFRHAGYVASHGDDKRGVAHTVRPRDVPRCNDTSYENVTGNDI